MCKSERKKEEIHPKSFEEFEILRELDKRKLHSRYLCGILIAIVIWLIATGAADDELFSAWFSFASTLSSIILSVLAIILSITGEEKTEHIREQLSDTAKRIKESQDATAKINASIEQNIEKLNLEIMKLSEEIENVPKATVQAVTEFQNTRDLRNRYSNVVSKRSSFEWEKDDE